jgi:spermidine synthase
MYWLIVFKLKSKGILSETMSATKKTKNKSGSVDLKGKGSASDSARISEEKTNLVTIWMILIIIFSGFAALCYQVAWTRQLITITSATATAQATVLAVFMAGLGLGAWIAGRIAPLIKRPLLIYAIVEIGAALFAIVSPYMLDLSTELLPFIGQMVNKPVTAVWFQLGTVSLLMLLPTTLLGMSLPLIIEQTERKSGSNEISRRVNIGILYGFNTFGAAAGTLAAGFWTMENLGLSGTLWIGGVLAVIASAMAIAISNRQVSEKQSGMVIQTEIITNDRFSAYRLLIAALLSGVAGFGAEVVWTRLFSIFVPTTVYAISMVLAAVLVGIAFGGGIAAILMRKTKHKDTADKQLLCNVVWLQLGAAVLTSLVAVILVWKAKDQVLSDALASGLAIAPVFFLFAVLVPPAALNGSALPMLLNIARLKHGSRAFGFFYAVNTAGCIIGSLVAGFIMLPILGTQISLFIVALLNIGCAIILLTLVRSSLKTLVPLVLSILVCFSTVIFVKIPSQIYEGRLPPQTRILDLVEGVSSDVMVTEDDIGSRRLWINSVYVAASGRHRLLGHLPALMVDSPKQVLGMALGTGQTFGSALKHGTTHFDCVEINHDVIKLSKKWFSEHNRGILEDPRVRITIADGRTFLRTTPEHYDLVVIEPLQAWSVGTTALYTREFYLEVKKILNAGGALAQWIPFYGQGVEETRSMVLTAIEVFPEASLWLDAHDGILILRSEPGTLSSVEFFQRISDRGIEIDLKEGDVQRHADLLSLYLAGPEELRAWVGNAKRITDNRPFLEYVAARQLRSFALKDILASIKPYLGNVSTILSADENQIEILAETHEVRETMLSLTFEELPSARAQLLETGLLHWPSSQRIAAAYQNEIDKWARELLKRPGGDVAARDVLVRGLEHLPDFGDAAYNLAGLYANNGQLDVAIEIARQALAIESTRPQMQILLDKLLDLQKAKGSK